MSSSALGAKHIHRFILLKIFSTGQWKFSDFVTNYIPVGPKAPEPPEPGLLSPAPLIEPFFMTSLISNLFGWLVSRPSTALPNTLTFIMPHFSFMSNQATLSMEVEKICP